MSDKLFLLIQSLSKQEKRNFKLIANTNRSASNYIKLFDFLNTQKEYDEIAIKNKFKNETFIRQLHVTKNLLYTLILKSLHTYHAAMSADSIIKELLHFVEILYRKGLYEQCSTVLEKAKKTAVLNESFIVLLEIVEWQSKIAFIVKKIKGFDDYVVEGYLEEIDIYNRLKNKSDLRKLFFEVLILNHKGTPVRSKVELDLYDAIIDNERIKNKDKFDSFHSELLQYYIFAYYFLNIGDIINSSIYNDKIVELMESNPLQIVNSPIDFVAALNNQIYASIQLKKYKLSYIAICKLRNIPDTYNLSNDLSSDLKKNIFIRSYFLELDLYKESKKTEKAIELIDELQQQVNYWIDIPLTRHKIFLFYTISSFYFEKSDYSNSLIWVNRIMNITETKEPLDLFCFARILNLLIHYELKNYELIQNLHISNKRFFNKGNRMHQFENKVFDFIKNKLLKDLSSKELIIAFELLKIELQKTLQDDYEKKALQYFDYIAWIDRKIQTLT